MEIIKISIISIHKNCASCKLPTFWPGINRNFDLFLQNGLCKSSFSTLSKLFGKILPKVIKFCATIGTFCYHWETFIEISIKENNLLW